MAIRGPLIKSGKIRKMVKLIKFLISSAKFLKPIFSYKMKKRFLKIWKKIFSCDCWFLKLTLFMCDKWLSIPNRNPVQIQAISQPYNNSSVPPIQLAFCLAIYLSIAKLVYFNSARYQTDLKWQIHWSFFKSLCKKKLRLVLIPLFFKLWIFLT